MLAMHVPFVDLKSQYKRILPEITESIHEVLTDCSFVYGKYNQLFDNKLATLLGVRYAIGCASGTAALHLALTALGVGPGDEVIVPANSFISTALAVTYTGATVVFADVDTKGLLDITDVMSKLTHKTKAVIPVHLYGNVVDIPALRALCGPDVYIVEDACQAIGAIKGGGFAGSFGDVACFSFYPAKNLGTCGQGGAVVTNNAKIATIVESLVNIGRGENHYTFDRKGFNYRLDHIKAAFLYHTIDKVLDWNRSRRNILYMYNFLLSDADIPAHIILDNTCLTSAHLAVLLLDKPDKRDKLAKYLQSKGISTGVHYPTPIHKTEAYSEYNDYKLPVAEDLSSRILSLPLYPTMNMQAIEYVTKNIIEVFLCQ